MSDLSNQPASVDNLQVGDRLSIFTIVHKSDDEVVLEDNDKHLQVLISIQRNVEQNNVSISSVVHVHNWLGKFYMFFVGPVHRLIVPTMLLGITK